MLNLRISINVKKLLFLIFLFIYVFQLPLSRISMLYISSGLAFIYLIINTKFLIINKNIVRIILGFLPFYIYFFITMIVHTICNSGAREAYEQNIEYVILYTLVTLIAISFLLAVVRNGNYSADNITISFIIITFVQFLCVIFSLLIPSVKEFFNSFIIRYSHSKAVVNAIIAFGSFRSYGFADNLFDQFGYISALLITITFSYGLFYKKKKYIFLSI